MSERGQARAISPARERWGLALALVVLCGALYGRAGSYPLVWDDKPFIAETHALDDPATLWRVFGEDFWARTARPFRSGMYRPLVVLSYGLERQLFGRSSAAPHGTNLAVHLAVVLLVFALALRLGAPPAAAALAAGVFAVHPAVVIAAVNVTSRTDALAALFLLLAVHAALGDGRPVLRAAGAGAGLLAALLCKETAIAGVLPLSFLAWRRRSRHTAPALRVALPVALAAAVGLYLALRAHALGGLLPAGPRYTLGEHPPPPPIGGPALTLHYLLLALVPMGLSPYAPAPTVGWGASLGALFVLGGLAWLLWRRGWWRPLAALGWSVAALAPVTGWIAAPARLSHLFLYLPLAGSAALLAPTLRPRWARAVAGGALILAAILAWPRVALWSSDLSLWRAAAEANSDDPSVHLNLGNALAAAGRGDESQAHLLRAVALARAQGAPGTAARALFSLGNGARTRGALDVARQAYTEAERLSEGRLYQASMNLALTLADLGDLGAAEAAARRATEQGRRDPGAWNILGVVLARQGRLTEARAAFEAALRAAPADRQARRNLARLATIEARRRPEADEAPTRGRGRSR